MPPTPFLMYDLHKLIQGRRLTRREHIKLLIPSKGVPKGSFFKLRVATASQMHPKWSHMRPLWIPNNPKWSQRAPKGAPKGFQRGPQRTLGYQKLPWALLGRHMHCFCWCSWPVLGAVLNPSGFQRGSKNQAFGNQVGTRGSKMVFGRGSRTN